MIFGLLYPVTMLSNAFVAPELMPGWLGAIAEWNPLSSTITATRQLFGNPGVRASGWLGRQRHPHGGGLAGGDHRAHAAAGRPGLPSDSAAECVPASIIERPVLPR